MKTMYFGIIFPLQSIPLTIVVPNHLPAKEALFHAKGAFGLLHIYTNETTLNTEQISLHTEVL
jgi:hypothetical protein